MVLREIRRLCEKLEIAVPSVQFREMGHGWYEEDKHRLSLPQPDFALAGQPDLRGEVYWLLVAHELAHYVSHTMCNKPYHSPNMYAAMTGIVLMWDLPLRDFYEFESTYSPDAFRAGRRLAGWLLSQNLRTSHR